VFVQRIFLPAELQSRLRSFFEADVSSISIVESDGPADHNAFAFACGDEIHVWPRAGEFLCSSGLPLLVHEVAHCLQQRGSSRPVFGTAPAKIDSREFLEDEANEAAESFVSGVKHFQIRRRDFETSGPVVQRIETATLRAWLGDAEFNQLKAALGGNFAVLLGVSEQSLDRFKPGPARPAAAARAALNGFFGRFPGITAQQATDLLAAMPGLSASQCADLVTGLPGVSQQQVQQFVAAFPLGGVGQLARLITRLAPLTGQQIITLVQSLMQQRVFTLLHIYSIVEILSTNNGTQIQNFFNLYTLVNGQPLANVVRGLHFAPQPLSGAQIYDLVNAVGNVGGIAGGFTIHSVLMNLPGPVGPVRMHAISQVGGRTLVRLDRMLNGHITPQELETALGVAPLNNDQHLDGIFQALINANVPMAEIAFLFKVLSNQTDPVMPADTLAKKVALFLRYHCGQRASDIAVGDDTTVEQTTQDNPNIRTNRGGGWAAVTKVHIRLSRRGLNHFKRRHFVAHFDFDDIKAQNTFFPHGANIQDELVFQVSCETIDAMNGGGAPTQINNGFAMHNVTVQNISYRVGVNWTATPANAPAQPIARFDQFFITNGPPLGVIQIPQAEMNAIETILIAAQKIN
jgi:hypothetical protein